MKTLQFILILLLSFILNSCVKDTETKVDLSKILELKLFPNNKDTVKIPADGTTKIKLTAVLGDLSDDKKNVIFYASSGDLLTYDGGTGSNNVTQEAINKEASVQLRTSTIPDDGVFLTAKVDNYFVKRPVVFTNSHPDTVFIKPDAYFTTSDKIEINVELLKLKGFVSSKVPVYFKIIDSGTSGLQVTIDPYKFSDNGSKINPSVLRSTLQKINENVGKVTVEVSTIKSNGGEFKKTVQVEFK